MLHKRRLKKGLGRPNDGGRSAEFRAPSAKVGGAGGGCEHEGDPDWV